MDPLAWVTYSLSGLRVTCARPRHLLSIGFREAPGPWLPSLLSVLGSGLSPGLAAPGQAGSVPLAVGVWLWWAALTSPWFSSALLRADRAEAACCGLSLWGAPVVGGGLLIVLLSEVHHTETLTDQELGCIPWPLASLSQGDLFGNALRPDAAD